MRDDVMSGVSVRRSIGGAALALLLVGGCARAPVAPAAAVSAVPAGSARIWFYRDYEPSVSLNLANVALNGAPAGCVEPDGTAFHRDLAPGHYHITVESTGTDVNQAKDVDLGPGQEAFVKILNSASWESSGEQSQYHRDTFYVSLMLPQVARAEMATDPALIGHRLTARAARYLLPAKVPDAV